MNEDLLDQLNKPHSPRAQHAVLVAALLHLMSHYAINSARGREHGGPCVKLASVIERHLAALARSADADPVLRATCEQLGSNWASLVDSALPVPAAPKRPLLERILRPGARRPEPAAAAA